ncbi:MAG: pilin glycosylation ligase domain-containing protein [Thermodesulfovibrionia bacterium]|nr:pilin glycosylation ligase domain-containing protein [Thermodesulfovibrionia bacterium]
MIKNIYLWILGLLFLVVSHIAIKNFGGSLVLPVAYFVWITLSGIVLLSVIQIFNEWKISLPHTSLYILIFLLLLLPAALFNHIISSHVFIFETVGLIGGIIFFMSLHQFELTDEERERFLYVIFISGMIEALISLFQYFNPDTGIFLIVIPASKKVFGNFQHQNLLASYLATSVVISLYLLTGGIFKGFSKWLKAIFYLTVLLMCFVIFLTGSRAGVIETGAGALILLWARYGRYREKALYPAIWLLMICVGISGSVAVEKYYYKRDSALSSVGQKIGMTMESVASDEVTDSRVPMYLTAISMIKDKPLEGHGPGSFGSKFMHYRSRLAKEHPEYPYEAVFMSHPHNEFLYRTAESGLMGGAGLLIVGIGFIVCLVKLGRERGGVYAAFLFPIAFDTQVSYSLYQSMPHWALFLFLLYLPSSYFIKEVRMKPVSLLKTGALAASATFFVVITYLSITTLNAQIAMKKYQDHLLKENIIRTELLMPSLNNIYLRQIGVRLLMDAKLRAGLMRGDRALLEEFVEFSREERKVYPHSVLYVREARALFDLRRKDEAYRLLEEGLSLYPGRADLKATKKEFLLEDAKVMIQRMMDKGKMK